MGDSFVLVVFSILGLMGCVLAGVLKPIGALVFGGIVLVLGALAEA